MVRLCTINREILRAEQCDLVILWCSVSIVELLGKRVDPNTTINFGTVECVCAEKALFTLTLPI